jgi:protein SCO1/2
MYRIVFSKNKLLLSLLAILVYSCSRNKSEALPYYNTPDFTPIFIQNTTDIADSISHQIGNFSFTDQDGKIITHKNIEGKIHVANFVFTSCGSICPKMTSNLKSAGDFFKTDSNVIFLSYSVTPWIDSIPTLKRYKSHNLINNENWHFLTGSQSAIYSLARTSYFAEEDLGFTKDSTEFLHTEHILLVDKSKRIRGIYNGTLKLDIVQLIGDIETLERE